MAGKKPPRRPGNVVSLIDRRGGNSSEDTTPIDHRLYANIQDDAANVDGGITEINLDDDTDELMAQNGGVLPPNETPMPGTVLQDGKMRSEYTADGGIEITMGDGEGALSGVGDPSGDVNEHHANLAEHMTETDLNKVALDIMDMIDADIASASPWRDRLNRGFKILGIKSPDSSDIPFKGAADITHPLLAEAVVQFNARAYPELMPPNGPVKGLVVGEEDEKAREMAKRVEDHMNFQILEEDECYTEEFDQLLFYLPFAGSAFKKVYRDEILGINVSRFVKAESVILPYTAVSLENSPRVTVEIMMLQNDVKKLQASKFYRDIDLVEPNNLAEENSEKEMKRTYDEMDGKEAVLAMHDGRHCIYECMIDYDLTGFEDKNEAGEETGVALPYIVSIDKESQKVLAIRRNWRENDKRKRKRNWLVHYKYLPGLGAYGFGLVHVLGGLAEACTGSVRALLDSASFATLQGGFKSKDARLPTGEVELTPGTWIDVDLTAEELQNAFYTPPFKEPSPALFEMLKVMEENGRRFAGTTEAVVGDANNTGPVGTTVALIEQGTKVMSGIHRRLHRAQQKEFELRAELNAEYLPEGGMYYDVAGGRKFISMEDYSSSRVKVVPVSDPNITSSTQRIAVAQGTLQLAESAPHLYKMSKVHRLVLEAMGNTDTDEILNDPDNVQRFDAVSEGSRLLARKPIKAFQDQNHEAHKAVHMAHIEYYKTLPDQQAASGLIMQMVEHIAKHEAYNLYNMMQMAIGQQLPPIDLYAEQNDAEMPPEIENQVSTMAAQFMAQLIEEMKAKAPPPPEDALTKAKIARDNEMAANDENRKNLSFQSDERRKQASWEAEQVRAAQSKEDKQPMEEERFKSEREDKDHEKKMREREMDIREKEVDIKREDSGVRKKATEHQMKSESDKARAEHPELYQEAALFEQKQKQLQEKHEEEMKATRKQREKDDKERDRAMADMRKEQQETSKAFLKAMGELTKQMTVMSKTQIKMQMEIDKKLAEKQQTPPPAQANEKEDKDDIAIVESIAAMATAMAELKRDINAPKTISFIRNTEGEITEATQTIKR